MNEIRIVSLNQIGNEAIRKGLVEDKKLGYLKRKVMDKLYERNVITTDEDLLIMSLKIKDPKIAKLVKPEHLQMQMDETMRENGAQRKVDYIYEVKGWD